MYIKTPQKHRFCGVFLKNRGDRQYLCKKGWKNAEAYDNTTVHGKKKHFPQETMQYYITKRRTST